MPQTLDPMLATYLSVLASNGSPAPEMIHQGDVSAIATLDTLDEVTLPDELRDYLLRIDGYDPATSEAPGRFEPEFAWGMFALDHDGIRQAYEDGAGCGGDEAPDYWPMGFVPILSDGAGSYVVVNGVASSPTYAAVYDMTDGVGCNRLAGSLTAFLHACTQEITTGLRRFESGRSLLTVDGKKYLEVAAPLFGHSPYFSRPGRMDTQIVDWR